MIVDEDGVRIAVFYTKACNRLLIPLTAADRAQAPPDLRAALAAITRHVDDNGPSVRHSGCCPGGRRRKARPDAGPGLLRCALALT